MLTVGGRRALAAPARSMAASAWRLTALAAVAGCGGEGPTAPPTQAVGVEMRLADHGAWPDISGERVVWRQSGPEGKLVMLLDLSTGEQSVLASGHRFGDRAVVSGTRVAWHDTPGQDAAAANITVADLSTGTLTELRTEANQAFPALSENRVVWEDRFVGQSTIDIVAFDFSAEAQTRIKSDSTSHYQPDIRDGRIVWWDERSGNADIYMFDLATGQERQITSDPGPQFEPRISGDRIVWTDGRNGNADIYAFDLTTGRERQITSDPADQKHPDLSGDRVVWQDERNGNKDIYAFDFATGQELAITTDSADQTYPRISGDRVVWQDFRGSNRVGIFLFEFR